MEQMKAIRKIRKKYEKNWLSLSGVVGVGVGNTSTGNVGIIVSVSDNADTIRQKIPAEIGRVSIEVQISGEIIAFGPLAKNSGI